MKIEELQQHLAKVFTYKEMGEEKIPVFSDDYLFAKDGTIEKTMYETISNVQRKSDLTFEFSYQVMDKVLDILSDLSDWNDDDELREAIFGRVPIYNNELAEIYASNSWVVDEAMKELGPGEDSVKNAAYGWYKAISDMAYSLKNKLDELIEE